MLRLCLALICLGLATQINCENVPAIIFGDKTPAHFPTLEHLKGDEFATLIKSHTSKDTLAVVFVEEKLSVEDFSQCRLKTKTCFENLNSIERKSYLSSVAQPVDSLLAAFGKQKSISVSNEGDLKDATVDGERILFIYFDEVESAEDFHKHDALINKLYSQLKEQHGNIVAIYTGIHPSFSYSQVLKRKVREAEPAEDKPAAEEVKPVSEEPKPAVEAAKPPAQKPKQQDEEELALRKILFDDARHSLIALSEVHVDNVTIDISTFAVTAEKVSDSKLNVVLTSGAHKLLLNTIISGGTWYVNFKYNDNDVSAEVYHPRQNVYAFGTTFSFGCGSLVIESSQRRHTITLVNFQYMPFFEAVSAEDLKFPDHVSDCVGFFSPAIWGALFVIILLMSIMSWGLYNMMDIRTMDRFDDPKGKTIIINAQE